MKTKNEHKIESTYLQIISRKRFGIVTVRAVGNFPLHLKQTFALFCFIYYFCTSIMFKDYS